MFYKLVPSDSGKDDDDEQANDDETDEENGSKKNPGRGNLIQKTIITFWPFLMWVTYM